MDDVVLAHRPLLAAGAGLLKRRGAAAAAVALLSAGLAAAPAAGAAEPVVAYVIADGARIPESLTGAPGDAERGRALYADAERAGCEVCHGVPGQAGAVRISVPGPDGEPEERPVPDLGAVGRRLDPGEIRLWIVALRVLRPDAAMPAFYAAGQRRAPDDPLYGGPRLTAAEIEDLVAYLARLDGAE